MSVTRSWMQRLFDTADPRQLAEAVLLLGREAAGEAGVDFSRLAAAAIASRLSADLAAPAAARFLNQDSAALRFAAAEVLRRQGRDGAAEEALDAAVRAAAPPIPTLLLERVRRDLRVGRWDRAVKDFRLALQQSPTYTFYLKAERLWDPLRNSPAWQPRRKLRLALLASTTTALLRPVLQINAMRFSLELTTYEGAYGAWQQEVLDSSSGLYQFHPEAVLLLPCHEDLGLGPTGSRQRIDQAVGHLRQMWQLLGQRTGCRIVQAGYDLPPAGPWGSLESTLAEGRRRLIREANLALASDLPPHVSFVDVEALAAESGVVFRSDLDWLRARQHPAPAALPVLADAVSAQLAAGFGLTKKLLVLDLDNTLWGGIIGEDGLGGIKVGPPSAEGEGYAALQDYCRGLRERGVLLAVCSKNNPDEACLPFREHDAMRLRLDDFASFHANWEDKATNLRRIAGELSLGLDSFVLLDDNPVEREWVRQRLPEVTVLDCSSHPWEMLAALRRSRYFEAVTLTPEDMARHALYRGAAARRDFERTAESVEQFLADLEMTAEDGPVDERTLPRVAQLVNKTNQFNLTTRRRSEAQIRALAASPDWWCRWFRLKDRFTDHGLIGVIFAHSVRPGDPSEWLIDTWLMSCRVLGRRMERYMLQALVEGLRPRGVRQIVGEYVPTEKNALVRDIYVHMGFTARPDLPACFAADLTGGYQLPACPWIQPAAAAGPDA